MLREGKHFLLQGEVRTHPESFDELAMRVVDFYRSYRFASQSVHDEVPNGEEQQFISFDLASIPAPGFKDHLQPEPLGKRGFFHLEAALLRVGKAVEHRAVLACCVGL